VKRERCDAFSLLTAPNGIGVNWLKTMPRKSERKTELSYQAATKALQSVVKDKANADGDPKSNRKFDLAHSDQIAGSARRLVNWLCEFEADNDKTSFSVLLQIWLNECGVRVMDDVFKMDIWAKGRGRPHSELGERALKMYRPNVFGWRKVARELIPERYKANPDKATKDIKDLAKSAKAARNLWDPTGDMLGLYLLGFIPSPDF
jgi:hypothetical protein